MFSCLWEPLLLKTYWWEGWHWPPAGKLQISGIQKAETLIFVIFDIICVFLNKIRRNSCFTGSVGLIIASSRSGMGFSSCLTSSIYFSIRNMYVCFYGVKVFLCSDTHCFHSLKSISGPCSIEKVYPREWRIAIPASLKRVDKWHSDDIKPHQRWA